MMEVVPQPVVVMQTTRVEAPGIREASEEEEIRVRRAEDEEVRVRMGDVRKRPSGGEDEKKRPMARRERT